MKTKETFVTPYAMETAQTLKKGQEICGIVRSVSASGLSRKISFFAVVDGELLNLTYCMAQFLGEKVGDYCGFNVINVQGVGMDMIFSTVYNFGIVLHDDGYYFKNRQI
jgi:hypothetical protein